MKILYNYWNRLIEPHASIVDAEEHRRAQFFSGLMLALVGLTSVYVIFTEIFITQNPEVPSSFLNNLIALTIIVCGYLLSRSRFVNLAAIVFIIIFTVFLYVSMAFGLQEDESAIGMIFYSIFTVLIAGVIFSNRGLFLVTLGNFIAMFLYAGFGSGMTAPYALGYVINSSLLVAITAVFLAYRIHIDEQRRQELAQNEKQWRDLIEFAPMAIAVHVDGKFVYINPMGLKLFGAASPQDILGKPITDCIHPDYRKIVKERIQRQQKGERTAPMMQKFVRLNGESFDVEVTGIAITYQGQSMIQAIFRDITESKQAEDALRESEKLLLTIADNYPNSYLSVIEEDYSVGFTSGQEFKKRGLDPQQFIGLTMEQVFGDKTTIVRQYYDKTFQGEECSFELSIDGQYQLYRTVPLLNEDGFISRILAVAENITERKQAEKQRLELEFERERTQILARFITQASHEFRTPLSLINTCTYLLKKNISPDKNEKQIHTINEQVKSITKLIEEMMTMTKLDGIQELEREETNICTIITNINTSRQALFRESKLQSILKLEMQEFFIYADSDYLQQALAAIIDNAIRFTPEGGIITISLDKREDNAIIEISDTGFGINAEDLPHIFKRFYRWDKVGTTRGFGLGLPIAKSIIELHQGHIEVKSEVGKGSTFKICLPMEL